VFQIGVDDSVFFVLSLNDLEGVCGFESGCEHSDTDRPQLYTFMTQVVLCNVHVLLFLKGTTSSAGARSRTVSKIEKKRDSELFQTKFQKP
jgi:hypothetical protein